MFLKKTKTYILKKNMKFHGGIRRVILAVTYKKSLVSRSAARFSNYDTFAKRSPIPNRFTSLTSVRESGCERESKLDGNAEFDLRSISPHLINRKFTVGRGASSSGYF